MAFVNDLENCRTIDAGRRAVLSNARFDRDGAAADFDFALGGDNFKISASYTIPSKDLILWTVTAIDCLRPAPSLRSSMLRILLYASLYGAAALILAGCLLFFVWPSIGDTDAGAYLSMVIFGVFCFFARIHFNKKVFERAPLPDENFVKEIVAEALETFVYFYGEGTGKAEVGFAKNFSYDFFPTAPVRDLIRA